MEYEATIAADSDELLVTEESNTEEEAINIEENVASPCDVRRRIEDIEYRRQVADELGFDDFDWAFE